MRPLAEKIFTEEEIEKFKRSLAGHEMGGLDNIFAIPKEMKENTLMEGYYKTYPVEDVKRYLKKRYGRHAIVETFENENGVILFRVGVYNDEDSKRVVDRDMSLCGYYPSLVDVVGDGSTQYIIYEPRYQDPVTEFVKKLGCVYHITKKSVVEKILEIGLCPKTNNKRFNYPDRIYLFLHQPSDATARTLISQFRLYDKNKWEGDNEYVLLKVDTAEIECEFFFDPNAEDCVYTKDNIHPKYISIEKEYLLK